MRRISSLVWWLPALWAIAFSLKSLREPDLWWQIRTGQLILQEGHVPVTDSFSYTQFGQAWINIKWSFEVVAALLAGISPELVLLLQT
ncbi:MAG: cytochrome C biosynthesis protein, partial [Chitinophagaceae bacterium]|nr:cytochrome C biosynthesis protein [Chitinophagaceae bacterium]